MWKVASFSDGNWTEVEPIELVGQVPTTSDVLKLAAEKLPQNLKHLLGHLESESGVIEHGKLVDPRGAIESWAGEAEQMAREFNWADGGRIEKRGEALVLYPEGTSYDDRAADPDSIAWNDHTAVIIPLPADTQVMQLQYFPELSDENRAGRLRQEYADSQLETETILDWRGYFGRESAVIDGWTMMRSQGHGYVASFTGTFGFVVGHVVRRLVRPQKPWKKDPTARGRLTRLSEKYREIAQCCPDLSRTAPVQKDAIIVFVHGTISCGIQGLKDFFCPGVDQPIFRFEHDTFLPVQDNGKELADLVEQKLSTQKLLLAGHSRGGLVARMACDELVRRRYSTETQVYTFGTPHLGTPLAMLGGELFNLLFKLSGDVVNTVPILHPLAKAYSVAVKWPAPPAGIAQMSEDSDVLSLLAMYGDPARVDCWGSEFRINSSQHTGFGVFTTGTLLGAMGVVPHDLVVPTHSALGFGNVRRPVLGCSHTQYFEDPTVQAAIRGFYPVALPVAQVAAAAAAGAAMALDRAITVRPPLVLVNQRKMG